MALNKEHILPHALQNAAQYGKASAAAVFGRVMGLFPEARADPAGTRKLVAEVVAEVNALPPEKKESLLKKIPSGKAAPVKKEKPGLPDLPRAQRGKVVTRFAPAPTGALSLFHVLRPIMLNYLYAQKYKGTFLVRIEDTDPVKAEKQFYRMIADDLRSLGVRWTKLTRESDDMPAYYSTARELLKKSAAYACMCSADAFRRLKEEQQDCPCRSAADNLAAFERARKGAYDAGQIVFRLKTSMQDPNPALRDPPLLRVAKTPHPLKGARYALWPLYNFANVVEDHRQGITHVFRGKEHENNSAVQERVYRALGWEPPLTLNFGMIRLAAGTLHKRDIRKMIADGAISGWDDPRLPTVRALLRRGFQPQAFRQAALSVGLTKNDITFTTDKLDTFNRRLIDPLANRCMAVLEPVQITVAGTAASATALEPVHPDFPARGKRKLPFLAREVYLSREDFAALQKRTFRLKGLGNIRLDGTRGTYAGNDLMADMPKIQWVSVPSVPILLRTPEGDRTGLGDVTMKRLKKGQLVQLERIGYARVDDVRKNGITLYFAHR